MEIPADYVIKYEKNNKNGSWPDPLGLRMSGNLTYLMFSLVNVLAPIFCNIIAVLVFGLLLLVLGRLPLLM